MTAINTGCWVYSLAALSLDSWAIVAQSEYDLADQRLIWHWPDWTIAERIAFDNAVEAGRVLKITGPAKQPPAQYWLYAKLARHAPKPLRRPLTLVQAGIVQRRALPEFA